MARGGQRKRRSRRLDSIVGFGAFVCAGLFAQSATTVPGMSQYTDANFGFSFWYPAAWRLTDGPVADPTDPTGPGWFSDATIVKELHIRNPAGLGGDQPSGVVLRALLAPAGLTELGQSMSASPVGVDVRYF